MSIHSTKANFTTLHCNVIATYIQQRQNTVAQYIATRPILDLCKAAERKQGAQ